MASSQRWTKRDEAWTALSLSVETFHSPKATHAMGLLMQERLSTRQLELVADVVNAIGKSVR